jgi:ACS family glucarate transporter-like MFS transporter
MLNIHLGARCRTLEGDVRGLNLKSSALYATLPFVAMALASSLGDPGSRCGLAALVLAGGAGALYFAQSAYWALSADVGGASVGVVSGVINLGSQTGGIVTASLTPVIANAYGWSASFAAAAVICLIGAALWLAIGPFHTLKSDAA